MIQLWLLGNGAYLGTTLATALRELRDGVHLAGVYFSAREVQNALDEGSSFDVALVDLDMVDAGLTKLLEELRCLKVDAPVIALTTRTDDRAIFSALRAGIQGYLTKDASLSDIVRAVVDAVAGACPLSPSISRRVVSYVRETEPRWSDQVGGLTGRERDVLELLCTGASYREVANAFGIAQGTVQTHVKRIYEKLGVCSKAEAVRMALDAN